MIRGARLDDLEAGHGELSHWLHILPIFSVGPATQGQRKPGLKINVGQGIVKLHREQAGNAGQL